MPSAPVRILAVAALCMLALIGLVVRESMARASGTEVQMVMAGVDPRSVLSGNYVTISLTEAIPVCSTASPVSSTPNEWIGLRREGMLAHADIAVPSRTEASQNGMIAVRGTLTCYDGVPASKDTPATPGRVTADLGIQRFYVDQADAERIGRLLQQARDSDTSPVAAIISIGQDGRARLKGLSVNGQRFDLGWL